MSSIQIIHKIFAGSETITSTLISVTYHLLRYPDTLQKLQMEVRAAFSSSKDITAAKATILKYLHAAVVEGMRIFSPTGFSLPRLIPSGGDSIDGCSLPGGVSLFLFLPKAHGLHIKQVVLVSVNPSAASLSPANFDSPLEYRPERYGSAQTQGIFWKRPNHFRWGHALAWVEGL